VKPLIAVSGPRRGAAAPRMLVQIAIAMAGGTTIQVGPGHKDAPTDIQGAVITGGHDVEPVLYAQESEVLPRYDRERDAYESELIETAISRQLPLLGICRGAQLLNVVLGGDLFQDLRDKRHHTSQRRTILPLKSITIGSQTKLAEILETRSAKVNSLHSQAINRLGDGLIVSARDRDGIIQGIETERAGYLIGTQWHPEFLIYQRPQRQLFADLVSAARQQS